MSVKVHIVDGTQYDSIEVERRINEFCKGKRIIDIKYQTIFIGLQWTLIIAH